MTSRKQWLCCKECGFVSDDREELILRGKKLYCKTCLERLKTPYKLTPLTPLQQSIIDDIFPR